MNRDTMGLLLFFSVIALIGAICAAVRQHRLRKSTIAFNLELQKQLAAESLSKQEAVAEACRLEGVLGATKQDCVNLASSETKLQHENSQLKAANATLISERKAARDEVQRVLERVYLGLSLEELASVEDGQPNLPEKYKAAHGIYLDIIAAFEGGAKPGRVGAKRLMTRVTNLGRFEPPVVMNALITELGRIAAATT